MIGREGPHLSLSCGARNSVTTADYLGDAAFQSFWKKSRAKGPHPKLRVLLTFPMAPDRYQHTRLSTWMDCAAAGGTGVDRLVYAV